MAIRVLLFLALIGCIQCKKPDVFNFDLTFLVNIKPEPGCHRSSNLSYAAVLNLSCQQVRNFVDGHNTRRQQLATGAVPGQPAASEMKSLIWDEELAAKAAKWASVYRTQHNPDRHVGSGRFTTGENIYWFSTTNHNQKLNPDSALQSWFEEHKDYQYGPIKASDFGSSKQIGHYTQMAWSGTSHVGCAISQWSVDGWNKFFVVCNYGPAGNMLGSPPYKSGRAAGHLVCGTTDCSRPYGDRC